MKTYPEPIITRIEEDKIVEKDGKLVRHIETIIIDRGEKLGKSTTEVYMQPDITFEEWQRRARPAINDALRPMGYRLRD